MRQRRILGILFSLVVLVTPSLAHHIAVVVDKDNKIENVTSAHLAKIFKGEVKKWPDGKNVVIVLHSSSADEVDTLAHVTKMSEAEVRATIVERKESIRKVATDAEVIEAVASTPGAIGLVKETSINGRVTVVKVDGKLPMESGYLPH